MPATPASAVSRRWWRRGSERPNAEITGAEITEKRFARSNGGTEVRRRLTARERLRRGWVARCARDGASEAHEDKRQPRRARALVLVLLARPMRRPEVGAPTRASFVNKRLAPSDLRDPVSPCE